MSGRLRRNRGNVLVIILVVVCLVVVPMFLALSQLGLYTVDRDRAQSVVDAACLVAANDISRIAINDRHFGFVSLSNYPPIGKATLAPDGEPLPVVGINTLIATIRQNTIVASKLNNSTMARLVDTDRKYLQATIAKLNSALSDSLSSSKKNTWLDIHGEVVDPYADVRKFLTENLPANIKLESFALSSGWLEDGEGTSSVAARDPAELALYNQAHVRAGQFKPFIDIPAEGKSFTFAGCGPSSRLVTTAKFRTADGRHVASIVKLECNVIRTDKVRSGFELDPKIRYVAASQPFSMPLGACAGVMTLRFTKGPVPALSSFNDLLSESTFLDRSVFAYRSVLGDFPSDSGARLYRVSESQRTAAGIAEHLYAWLRNGHTRASMASVVDMVNEPFRFAASEIQIFEFKRDGNISRRSIAGDPFPPGVTADCQSMLISDSTVQGGFSPVIIVRDNVRYLGTTYGGKHAGQPLTGSPLNWCELAEYSGDEQLALRLGKGRLATRLVVSSPEASTPTAPAEQLGKLFQGLDGKLFHEPRRTYYSGGLAVDIEVGGTERANPAQDLTRMAALRR